MMNWKDIIRTAKTERDRMNNFIALAELMAGEPVQGIATDEHLRMAALKANMGTSPLSLPKRRGRPPGIPNGPHAKRPGRPPGKVKAKPGPKPGMKKKPGPKPKTQAPAAVE